MSRKEAFQGRLIPTALESMTNRKWVSIRAIFYFHSITQKMCVSYYLGTYNVERKQFISTHNHPRYNTRSRADIRTLFFSATSPQIVPHHFGEEGDMQPLAGQ